MHSTPMMRMNGPPIATRYRPSSVASPNVRYVAMSIWRGEIKPAWVSRSGPSRSGVSAPRRKSNTSLAKLVPIWISSAVTSVARKVRSWISCAPNGAVTVAMPTTTGTIDAGSVAGRAAMSQRRSPEQRGVAGELLQAGQPLGRSVERGFDEPQRGRTLFEDLAAPLDCRVLQLGQRDDRVDQAHLQRLLGRILATQEPDLLGLLVADEPSQQRRSVARVEAADARPGLPEACVVSGDGQVADHVQHVAAADGVARDHGDD